MNIKYVLISERGLFAQAVEERLESHGNFMSVIQDCICERGSVNAEKEHVNDDVSSTNKWRRIRGIFFGVKVATVIDGAGNVVESASVVVHSVGVDGQVTGIVDIFVPEGHDNPDRRKGANKAVERAEEWDHEGVCRVPEQNIPIPGRERVQAQAVVDARNDVKIAVTRSDPADPVEFGQRGEDVVGKPEPHKHGAKHEVEEFQSRNAPHLAKRASNWRVTTSVECRVEGNGNQRGRPDAIRRVHQEATADSCHSVANKVGGQGDENLIGKVGGVRLVKVLWQILDPDDVVCIWRIIGNVGHDCDEHVLLSRKGARVEAMANAHHRYASIWKPSLGGLPDGICQQLGNIGHDANSRLANVEQLIDKGKQSAKGQADGPAANGG